MLRDMVDLLETDTYITSIKILMMEDPDKIEGAIRGKTELTPQSTQPLCLPSKPTDEKYYQAPSP